MERSYVKRIFIFLFPLFCFVSCFDSFLPYQSVKWSHEWEFRFLTEEELVGFRPAIEDLSLEYQHYSIPYISLEKPMPKYLSARIRFRDRFGYEEPALLLRGLVTFLILIVERRSYKPNFFVSHPKILRPPNQ